MKLKNVSWILFCHIIIFIFNYTNILDLEHSIVAINDKIAVSQKIQLNLEFDQIKKEVCLKKKIDKIILIISLNIYH